jgi:pimeloyl-ACP methyl ester carboxylesterase
LSTDTIHFYPFTSVVIAFGGYNAVPLDAGSGPFQMALNLYERGYDVHAYNERTLTANPSLAYEEVVRAIQNRGVSQVAIFGHSYGGGGTYILADQLNTNRAQIGTFTIGFTAYIDAIEWNTWTFPPELRPPPGSTYHVNYFQFTNIPNGGLTAPPVAFNLNVNTTAWGAALLHAAIDNDPTVQQRILNGSTAAAPEGPHAGLTQTITP